MKLIALLLAGAVGAAGCANAQGLTLSPVMLSAPAEGGAAALTIRSDIAEPKMVQVRVFNWTQAGGQEQMIPATHVRFGPEIFELAPGKSQTVRFQLPDTDGAGTWRVVVDELPPSASSAAGSEAQLSLRLRYVLSMFAGPAGAPAQLQAHIEGTDLELGNPGPGWLKLSALGLVSADGASEPARSGIVYLLPGATTRIPAPAVLATATSLTYEIGQKAYSLDLRPAR